MRWLVIVLGVLLASIAVAQVGQVPIFVQPPPETVSCSNQLDFSQACNSQYLQVTL
jgi:hypothetical protein